MRWLQLNRRRPGGGWFTTLFFWTFMRHLAWIWCKVLYRVQLLGFEDVPARGPVIFASNHQSFYDPILAGLVVWDRGPAPMARATLFSGPLGWGIRRFNTVSVRREISDTGAIKATLRELAEGRTVLIFPEGARTWNGALGEFRRGVAVIARRSGVPIVPVAIEGAFEVWPRTRKRPRLRGRIAVRAGPPVTIQEFLDEDDPAGLERLRRLIETMRLELREGLRQRTKNRLPPPGPADRPYWEEEEEEGCETRDETGGVVSPRR